MADFMITTAGESATSWEIIGKSSRYALAIERTPTPHDIDYIDEAPYLVVVLSNTDKGHDVLRALRASRNGHFIDNLGVSAGLIWNTENDEICIFRDKMGLIPILVTSDGRSFCATTSPQKHAQFNCRRAVNPRWFSRFLYGAATSSRDDVWIDTFRLYPGEVRVWGSHGLSSFLAPFVPNPAPDDEKRADSHSDLYWKRRRYAQSDMTFEAATEAIRACHARAVGRIPTFKPLIFTLSGGLDSTGIVATYARATGADSAHRLTTFSLLSRRHASCDESPQIAILSQSLPIDAHRIDMGTGASETDADISLHNLGYGPLCGPGLQMNLHAYRQMAPDPGSRIFITGYGGNFLVKVRTESIWRSLLTDRRFGDFLCNALRTPPSAVRYMAKRLGAYVLAKSFKIHKVTPSEHLMRSVCRWGFCERYPAPLFDEIFALTHCEERAQIPMTDEWEYFVRAVDATARSAHQYFFDPLLDSELYDLCAQIPAIYWDYRGRDRAVYRAALAPVLPERICNHPKVQSFDEAIIDMMRQNIAHNMAHESRADATDGIIDGDRLEALQRAFLAGDATASLGDVWRLTAADWWDARVRALARVN